MAGGPCSTELRSNNCCLLQPSRERIELTNGASLKATDLLAIYGACLSTIVFVWNVSRALPRYKVDVVRGVDDEKEQPRHGVYICVRNSSSQTVHLASIDFLYPYRNTRFIDKIHHIVKFRRMPKTVGWVHSSLSNYGVDEKCPLAVGPGKSHRVFVPEGKLEEMLKDSTKRRFRACVQDQLWRNKYSSVFEYPKPQRAPGPMD